MISLRKEATGRVLRMMTKLWLRRKPNCLPICIVPGTTISFLGEHGARRHLNETADRCAVAIEIIEIPGIAKDKRWE